MSLRNSISLRGFTVYMETRGCLKFPFGRNYRSELQTDVKFTPENISEELKKNRVEICNEGEISNRFKFTSYRILLVSGFQSAPNALENNKKR